MAVHNHGGGLAAVERIGFDNALGKNKTRCVVERSRYGVIILVVHRHQDIVSGVTHTDRGAGVGSVDLAYRVA